MSKPADVEKYLNDSELALSHLPELFQFLNATEPEVSDYAVEALENCGVPRQGDVKFLCNQCASESELSQYWACTLLGRMVQEQALDLEPNESKQAITNESEHLVERTLQDLIRKPDVGIAVKEKAVLVFTHVEQLDEPVRDLLTSQMEQASPRLRRLIESALHKKNC